MKDIRSTLKLKRLLFCDQKISTVVILERIVSYNNQPGLDLNNKNFYLRFTYTLELCYYNISFPEITIVRISTIFRSKFSEIL